MCDFRWRRGSSGEFGFGRDLDSVVEFYTLDDFRQLVLAFQSPTGFQRRHHQLENHEARGVLRQRAFHADCAMPPRLEHAFNWIGGPQMIPGTHDAGSKELLAQYLPVAIDKITPEGKLPPKDTA